MSKHLFFILGLFWMAVAVIAADTDKDEEYLRFASGNFDGWRLEGSWFLDRNIERLSFFDDPPRYIVSSYEAGEANTAKLTSDPFVIYGRAQQFYIAGWDREGEDGKLNNNAGTNNYVRLKSWPDGEILRQEHTPGHDKLKPALWLTADLIGREVYLEVVDGNPSLQPGSGYAWIAFAAYRQLDLDGYDGPLNFPDGTLNGWSSKKMDMWSLALHPDDLHPQFDFRLYTEPGDVVRRVVSSFEPGETNTGSLISPVFTIEKPYQFFSLAGWDGPDLNKGLNFVRLCSWPDGEELKRAVPQGNIFARISWRVPELMGEEVYIEIVDGNNETGYAWLAFADYCQGDNPYAGFSSNLPLIMLETGGRAIPGEERMRIHMKLIDDPTSGTRNVPDGKVVFEGDAGIKLRGTSSRTFPKKQYSIELWGSVDEEDVDEPLLGMPEESDWVIHGPYSDKTLMRNWLAYELATQMGHYASRRRYVEAFIDDQYVGVFLLMEKIKRDKNRVNIKKLEPTQNSEPSITGGYLIELSPKWKAKANDIWFETTRSKLKDFVFIIEHPSDPTSQQIAWIQNYMEEFETAFYSTSFRDPQKGYAKYLDVDAFIDYMWMNELSHNLDAFNSSTFIHKDRGGKLVFGPVWDFNLAFGNCDQAINNQDWVSPDKGWTYLRGNENWAIYAPRLLLDSNYVKRYHQRWLELRQGPFATKNILNLIATAASIVEEAQVRNFQRWPTLGVYVWPNPQPCPTTYEGEVAWLEDWIVRRLHWIDEHQTAGPIQDVEVWAIYE